MIKQITPEMARIHAHVCGDGCTYIKNLKRSNRELNKHKRKNLYEKIWVIEYTNIEEILRKEFIDDIKIAFNRKAYDYLKYKRVVLTHCKWILESLNIIGKNSYNWGVNKDIKSNKKMIVAWLRAFFDDEATVNIKQRMIRIKSMNLNGLKQVLSMLKMINIYSRITGQNCDNSWYLNIYRNDLRGYYTKVGFLHPLKKEKLNKILESGPEEI